MNEFLPYKPRTIEGGKLPPHELARVAELYSQLESTYHIAWTHEKYNLEELAISALKIEQFDASIALIKGRFETESRYAWDAIYQKNCHLDYRQFASKRRQTRSATVKTAELAEEIASAWSQFATFVENNQKHLISLDEVWLLLKYESLPTNLQSLNSKAQWLALHFLAHNARQEHFIKTWIKLDRIRDDETLIERLTTLISAMPDQATVHDALLDHAKSRVAFWEAQAAALRADSDQEKARFLASFQGTRETRDQLRFQLTCRRYETAHSTRLKKEIQRSITAREKEAQRKLEKQQRQFNQLNHRPNQQAITPQPVTYLHQQDQNIFDYDDDLDENMGIDDDSWLESIPDDDNNNCDNRLDSDSVNESAETQPEPATDPSFEFIDVNGKRYTKEDLDRVDDILQVVIGEYLAMLPPEIKHSADFIDGMSDPDRYSDFLMKAIEAVTDSKLTRLYLLQRKLNEQKSNVLSITGPSSPHGTRLFDDLRLDITEEMLKPHLKKIRREAAAKKASGIKPPKRLFKNDPRRRKPPD